MRTISSRTSGTSGFTLIEVLVAFAIIAIAAAVLLHQRVEVVRDAAKVRDARLGWTLAAWKMGEIERDPKVFAQDRDDRKDGTFEDYAEEYAEYRWEYELKKEEVSTNDGENPNEKPREIFRLTLTVLPAEGEPLIEIQGMFPIPKPPAQQQLPASK